MEYQSKARKNDTDDIIYPHSRLPAIDFWGPGKASLSEDASPGVMEKTRIEVSR